MTMAICFCAQFTVVNSENGINKIKFKEKLTLDYVLHPGLPLYMCRQFESSGGLADYVTNDENDSKERYLQYVTASSVCCWKMQRVWGVWVNENEWIKNFKNQFLVIVYIIYLLSLLYEVEVKYHL